MDDKLSHTLFWETILKNIDSHIEEFENFVKYILRNLLYLDSNYKKIYVSNNLTVSLSSHNNFARMAER